MASINKPTVVNVEATIRELVYALPYADSAQRTPILNAVANATTLDETTLIPFSSTASAQSLLNTINHGARFAPKATQSGTTQVLTGTKTYDWSVSVPSSTQFGVAYTVSGNGRGLFAVAKHCTCPNFDPERGNNPKCKHIVSVTNRPHNYGVPA